MSVSASFGDRLQAAVESAGRLCVGIDPHAHLLAEWGLPDSAPGARELGLRVVEAATGLAAIVKPQVAFFERFGAAGFTALEEVLAAARAAGLLVLADAKRGDIGSTADGYAEAWLSVGAPLEADAMTVSPYLGFGALTPFLDAAVAAGKGVFVLAATSNPEAPAVQHATTASGGTVAASIAAAAAAENARTASGATGSIGVVIGATVGLAASGIDAGLLAGPPATPVLAPGFGHQGASAADVDRLFGAAAPRTLVSESRSLLAAGPDGVADAIARSSEAVRRAFA